MMNRKEIESEQLSAWTDVRSKRKKAKEPKHSGTSIQTTAISENSRSIKQRKARSEAILLMPKEGKSYKDVLGAIRKNINAEEAADQVKTIKKTRRGGVLVELRDTKLENRSKFLEVLKTAAEVESNVKKLVPRMTLEIRDVE